MNILQDERFNHQSEVVTGVLEAECGALLSDFFRDLREKKKMKKKQAKEELEHQTGIDRG
jgi:tRNA(adenine34) deaminase